MIRSQPDESWWRASLPLDVLAVVVLCVLLAVQPVGLDDSLRVVLGLPFVLFAPGYLLLAALFPRRVRPGGDDDPFPASGLGWGERAALSVAASVSVVPLVALVMAAVGASFTTDAMQTWLFATVFGFAILAAARRYTLPPEERLVVPLAAWAGAVYDATLGASSRRDAVLNVALAVSVVLALGTVGYAVADAQQTDPYTGLSILTENEDGELVAADYAVAYTRNDTHSYVVQVENHRPGAEQYTVVTELQRVRVADDGAISVIEEETLASRSLELSSHETRNVSLSATPSLVGEDLRLVTFVYRGDVPDNPTTTTAEEYVFVWLDVQPSGPGTGGTENDTSQNGTEQGTPSAENETTDAPTTTDSSTTDVPPTTTDVPPTTTDVPPTTTTAAPPTATTTGNASADVESDEAGDEGDPGDGNDGSGGDSDEGGAGSDADDDGDSDSVASDDGDD